MDSYRKIPKNLDTWKYCCNHPKIWTMWIYHTVMYPNNADRMENSVDPDQNSLIWLYTVCPDLSVQKLRINKVICNYRRVYQALPYWSLVFGQIGLGKQCRPISDPRGAVWAGSTLFAICLHLLNTFLNGKATLFKFYIDYSNVLASNFFRIFMVIDLKMWRSCIDFWHPSNVEWGC